MLKKLQMSTWQNNQPQGYNSNNYQNQYTGHKQSRDYTENQYQNNYYTTGKKSKNPLNHQYSNKQPHTQNAYPSNNYTQQNVTDYDKGYQQSNKLGMGRRDNRYQTNDDVRPLTERHQQQFQQYPKSGYNDNPYLNSNRGYDQGNGHQNAYGSQDQSRGNRRNDMNFGGSYDGNYSRNNKKAYGSPDRGDQDNNFYGGGPGGFQGSPDFRNRSQRRAVQNNSMRETMDPAYGRNRGNNQMDLNPRQFLSPQPRREGKEERRGNNTSARDIQKPFWKSSGINNHDKRAKSRRMNLTLKDVNPGEENFTFRGNGNYGGFEPSTNDSARGIGSRNNDSKRESNIFFNFFRFCSKNPAS